MSRGKPSPEQLDLSDGLLNVLTGDAGLLDTTGEDTCNYGNLLGIPEARKLMAAILDVPADEVLIGNNSSLNLMYDTVARSMLYGVGGFTPWCKLESVKFLCPTPGYDRHFAITESMGFTNIEIEMLDEGPDMSVVEHFVNTDPAVKGIWCVPKYSNPLGTTYSDEVVRRFANLKPAAGDFRIFWDNAYAVHDLEYPGDELLSLRQACIEANNPDIYYMFSSTSKITYAGAGISALSSSRPNLDDILKTMVFQTIGADKVNQLRHVAFLHDLDGVKAHMRKHAAILAPKFAVVLETFERELAGLKIAEWTRPRGGYFISFLGLKNTAKRTVELAKQAGVVLTDAGATHPYGFDHLDKDIRIAPSYPSIEELALAAELFCVCVRIAALESIAARTR
ncbi:MAG TPA: aminotransferase [Coriobacteriia bacterium]|nr:aminotransferase [Coriobacteriia bacterium]